MTKGGDLVNVVPETAVIETLVRAKNLAAIEDASKKTDRSFKAGALALGAGITIETMPGYLPCLPQEAPQPVADTLSQLFDNVTQNDLTKHRGGSSDVGDVQHLMPVFSFNTGGAAGGLHSSQFSIVDEENAYLDAARVFAVYAYELLKNGAALARQQVEEYQPRFASKEEYVAYMDGFSGIEKIDPEA
jgi:metal-dependent amidase/aminoacylase/carboxypeptidase family protein